MNRFWAFKSQYLSVWTTTMLAERRIVFSKVPVEHVSSAHLHAILDENILGNATRTTRECRCLGNEQPRTLQRHQQRLWVQIISGDVVGERSAGRSGGGGGVHRADDWAVGYRTMGEFRDAVFTKYQQFYDQADAIAQARIAAGRWPNDPMIVGGRMDAIARARLKGWLSATEGIGDTSATGSSK